MRGGVDIFWAFVNPNKTGDPAKFNWKTPYNYDSCKLMTAKLEGSDWKNTKTLWLRLA